MMHPRKLGEIYWLSLKYDVQNLSGKSLRGARLLQSAVFLLLADESWQINLDHNRIIKQRILPFAIKPEYRPLNSISSTRSFYMQNMRLLVLFCSRVYVYRAKKLRSNIPGVSYTRGNVCLL